MRTASERAISSLRFQARTAGAIAERNKEISPGLFLSLSVLVLALVAFAPGRSIEAQVADGSQDLSTIGQIREEGLTRSHVMALASALCDDIGPRLSGSPDYKRAGNWALEVLKSFGVANAHREGFGVFGSPWTQLGTSVLLEQPTTATILAQATPWSPSTPGEVHAEAIEVPLLRADSDFAAWHSRLRGKIILYGAAPRIQAKS